MRSEEERYQSRIWSLASVSSFLFPLSTFLFIFISCGSDRRTFLLEGTFKGFNQGELYVYGQNGTHRLDTVSVVKGKFRYEVTLEEPVALSLVFPNFSELPVFAEPRAKVEIEGDASHLKQAKITGTDLNKTMTGFRMKTSQMTPPELLNAAEDFIKEQPESPISLYLLNRYFTQVPSPDYQRALSLISILQKAQPDEPSLKGLTQKMNGLKNLKDGNKLPVFTCKDVNGKVVRSTDLNGRLNIITLWAKWNYESTSVQRQLAVHQKQNGDKLKILSICVDADVKECRKAVERDSVKWSTVCDGRMWETPLVQQLGLAYVPDNILTDGQGKIIAHSLSLGELTKQISERLKDQSD